MHQLAMVSNELAVKEIEETRLAAREAYLKSLAEQPAGSAFRALPAASADLIALGREASDARTAIEEASQTIAGKQAEIKRLHTELEGVQAKLEACHRHWLPVPGTSRSLRSSCRMQMRRTIVPACRCTPADCFW
jgi:cob(I)alamin adenosyltransferase